MNSPTLAVNEVAVLQVDAPLPEKDHRSPAEQKGHMYADWLIRHFEQQKAQFVRDDTSQMNVIVRRKQIPLLADDFGFAGLMLGVCKVSTTSPESRVAIQRLNVYASDQASQMESRSFSAVVPNKFTGGKWVLVPASDKLLKIAQGSVQVVPNGTCNVWITHPKGEQFKYVEANPQQGLADFERLLVATQACQRPAMKWFVAMHEGLFPFVRDLASTRFILVHMGPTQSGKTTGAERFVILHGLGRVDGDATVAALSNEADPGLQVLDNKEQANFNQSLIDYCLFLSTGAERKRSHSDGKMRRSRKTQPAAVITSIESVFKAELQIRCVEVAYRVSGPKTDREGIEDDIAARRDAINSALMHVLSRFLAVRDQRIPTPNPFDGNFGTHFTALCDLLRAFGEVAGKPKEWAEGLVSEWDHIIRLRSTEDGGGNPLEFPIQEILEEHSRLPLPGSNVERKEITYNERRGTLYITTPTFLHAKLSERPALRQQRLPKDAAGLSRRLGSERFESFVFLRDSEDDQVPPELKRQNSKRVVGFFYPKDVANA